MLLLLRGVDTVAGRVNAIPVQRALFWLRCYFWVPWERMSQTAPAIVLAVERP